MRCESWRSFSVCRMRLLSGRGSHSYYALMPSMQLENKIQLFFPHNGRTIVALHLFLPIESLKFFDLKTRPVFVNVRLQGDNLSCACHLLASCSPN